MLSSILENLIIRIMHILLNIRKLIVFDFTLYFIELHQIDNFLIK
uniref:Uncharacterized protein n=1 Tax=Ascaris lumbricoides TaxID=6252 RepID=A0A0M3IWC3_ASCLU